MIEDRPIDASMPRGFVQAIQRFNDSTLRRNWAPALLLIAMTLIAYWPAMHGGFLWDDNDHISENPALRSLHGLRDIWFKPGATCQYYPLTFTGFWLGYQLWGLNPIGYHLLNALLHGVAAILLWQVLARLRVRGAWLAGALFALHPVCAMSVAWMTELKNTLSASLALAAAWAYLRFAGLGIYDTSDTECRTPNSESSSAASPGSELTTRASVGDVRRSGKFYLLSLALFQLALFAKSAVSFLPVSLLLVTWWKRERLRWRDVWPLTPMLALAGAMGWLTFRVEHLHGMAGAQFHLGFGERLLISGRSFWFYLGKILFPRHLNFIYERWNIDAAQGWQFLFLLLMIGVWAVLWWNRRRTGKGPLVALLHFYVCTSFLILLAAIYMTRYSFVSDHWQYFGCMSVLALAACGLASIRRINGTTIQRLFWCVPLLVILGASTSRQCRMYSDLETLWRTTLAGNPRAFLAHNNLACLLMQQGRADEALSHFQSALTIEPDFAEAHYNFGSALAGLGRLEEARGHFERALELQPDYAEAHNNLANVLLQNGRVEEAMAHLEKALQYQPDFAEAHHTLGNALRQKGNPTAAIAEFERALEIRPDYAEVHVSFGNALLQTGRVSEAIDHFQAALRIKPELADAHFNLGKIFLQRDRLDDAIVQFQKVLAIQPREAEAQCGLGIALLGKGRSQEAREHFQTASGLPPENARLLADLAWVLATCPDEAVRNGTKAVELGRRANELSGGTDPLILRALAAAYAEAGQFPEATATVQTALAVSSSTRDESLPGALRSQLELYQAGHALRDQGLGKRHGR